MKRTVIKIDEELCNGCGNCVSGCHEGALQLIDGKAVMVSDIFCDGLGACIGDCPLGAITLEEREAEPYDEAKVMARLVSKGEKAVLAHLKHLKEHKETQWLQQGIDYIKKNGITIDIKDIEEGPEIVLEPKTPLACGCPGSMAREIKPPASGFTAARPVVAGVSELRQFPVQLYLLNPQAGFLEGADLLLAADCTAFASGDFHGRFLRGKSLAIACPKLDNNTDSYVEKLVQMIDVARINTLTVLVMEVPCCQGLVRLALRAREEAERNIPIKMIVISVAGEVVKDEWI